MNVALIVGVEKFTEYGRLEVDEALATTSDSILKEPYGAFMTSPHQVALLVKRYMHECDVPADGFAGFRSPRMRTASQIKMPCSAKPSNPDLRQSGNGQRTAQPCLTWPLQCG
ncbi:hypothetical protein [Candidatus Villigracilis affinis]|uniref:hypothetical protein n=1 Tax=Candidatus Villigracilis affinis TaxID=3140682 RepID=UPI002A1B8825|nr:hypothetical protein [Anaerolineales bacterium]